MLPSLSSSHFVWYFIFNKQQHKFYASKLFREGSERQGDCSSSECLWLRERFVHDIKPDAEAFECWWAGEDCGWEGRGRLYANTYFDNKNKLCAIPSVCRAQIVCHVTFNAIYILAGTSRFECKSRGRCESCFDPWNFSAVFEMYVQHSSASLLSWQQTTESSSLLMSSSWKLHFLDDFELLFLGGEETGRKPWKAQSAVAKIIKLKSFSLAQRADKGRKANTILNDSWEKKSFSIKSLSRRRRRRCRGARTSECN